jgi:hypothetical protein
MVTSNADENSIRQFESNEVACSSKADEVLAIPKLKSRDIKILDDSNKPKIIKKQEE